jgi:anti-anti-sigma factor
VGLERRAELTSDAVATLRPAFESAVNGADRIVLDLAEATFADSAGLGMLVALNRRIRRQGGDLRLAAPSPEVRTVLELTRLHRLFEIYDDVRDAVRSFDA